VRVKLPVLRGFSHNAKQDSVANEVSGGAGAACVACTNEKRDRIYPIYGSQQKQSTFMLQ
jgi:hypothetical protein